ncbi:MAG TPA: hypothetical protein VN844_18585 [Pyrinomonadaceae bacterium]|nr:hypothetical protein [Pyrinomonadaceae bacterium]
MNITMQTPRVRIKNVCTDPDAGKFLAAYVVDQLDDAQAETMETHLNECLRCKEYCLTLLEARAEAPERLAQMLKENQEKTTVAPTPVDPVEDLTPPVPRKGKAAAH